MAPSLGSLFVGRQTVYLQSVGAAHIGQSPFSQRCAGWRSAPGHSDDRRLSCPVASSTSRSVSREA